MRYIGIDIAAETHVLAIVSDEGQILRKPSSFEESAQGYTRLWEWIGSPDGALVVMEATGHYWQNLFAALKDEVVRALAKCGDHGSEGN